MNRVSKLALASVVSAITVSAGQADVITSPQFSFGFGFSEGTWNMSETAAVSTPFTQGDFTLTPTVSGSLNSNTGPTFPDRVLTNGSGIAQSGQDDGTYVMNGAYTGAVPAGATNVRTRVIMDSLSVYVIQPFIDDGIATLTWSESTVGQLQSQVFSVTDDPGPYNPADFADAAAYQNIAWNPADALQSPGSTQGRTFKFTENDEANRNAFQVFDGLEFTGRVETSFDAVPEPTMTGLLGGGTLLLARRRRR